MSNRRGVTVIAKIKRDQLDPLRQLFCEIARDPESNAILPFGRVPGVHFARWVILPTGAGAVTGLFPHQLLYASEFDGSTTSHFEQLLDHAQAGMDRILEHCEGYPPREKRSRVDRLTFLQEHSSPFGSLYQSTTGSVSDIRREGMLRDKIQAFLDSRDWRGMDHAAVYQAIRDFADRDPALNWAFKRRIDRGVAWHLEHWGYTVGAVAATIFLLPVTLPLTLVWMVALRAHEKSEPVAVPTGNITKVSELTGYEDRGAQNQLTVIGIVKPGWFRRFTLWGVLRFFYLLVSIGIPFEHGFFGVKTIHFARFQLIDRGRRLLFMSNYDGSWESYLGDFVDRLSFGISGVWSNAIGFPETQFLVFGGARHEQVFKALVRDHQLPPAVWYSAYSNLTVENIKNNAAIRDGLARGLSGAELVSWLQRF